MRKLLLICVCTMMVIVSSAQERKLGFGVKAGVAATSLTIPKGEKSQSSYRAGFTGEKKGYEIYVAADQADRIEELLHKTGDAMGAVRMSDIIMRYEDYLVHTKHASDNTIASYMRDLRHTNPLEVGMEKGIGWDKEFIGKEALLKIKEEVPLREMVGFPVDEADVYIQGRHLGGPGQAVLVDGEEVGRVYKFVYSYVKDKNIGYILARKNTLKPGDKIKINGYDAEITEKYFL